MFPLLAAPISYAGSGISGSLRLDLSTSVAPFQRRVRRSQPILNARLRGQALTPVCKFGKQLNASQIVGRYASARRPLLSRSDGCGDVERRAVNRSAAY